MKPLEAIKRHPGITVATTAVLLAGAIEATGWIQNPTYERLAGACVSPVAASETYINRQTNLTIQTRAEFATTGIVAHGTLPPSAYGVEASFKAPRAPASAWNTNKSRMLKANDSGKFALKMAIGPSEVRFGVRVVAPAGSPLCRTAPKVIFTYKNANSYATTPGILPWPNPVNVVTNLFYTNL
ncbi:MAG TPA: hypothetical protein VLE73_02760 [Candidatus Saccharimonadales bacterium]|nr:hypothetical protein [Candidatus Saccharimonadales bacterium]